MRDIDKYSQRYLEEEAPNHWSYHVIKYEREEKSCGVTRITFDLMPGKHLHWLSIPSFGLFTPVCFLVNGLQYAVGSPKSVYFETTSGALLGESQHAASRNANKKGHEFLKQSDFAEAKDWFHKAYMICSRDDSLEDQFKNNRDSLALALEAQNLFDQNNYSAAAAKYQEAYNTSTDRTIKDSCRTLQVKCTRALYHQGQNTWNEAWEAESDEVNDRSDEAKVKFKEAKNKFDKAYEFASGIEAKVYMKWSQICSLKIDGNELFNQGVILQQQGNALRKQSKYREANNKYQAAEAKFKQGLASSKDQRFQACIELVQESINEARQAIQNLHAEELAIQLTELELNQSLGINSDVDFDALNQETPTISAQAVFTTNF